VSWRCLTGNRAGTTLKTMVDEKNPEAPSSESTPEGTQEKNELTADDLERVSGGFVLTPTSAVRATELTTASLGVASPLPDSSVL